MVVKHFGAEFVFPCAAAAGYPFAAEIANLTAHCESRQLCQRSRQYSLFARRVVRRSKGPADGMVDKGRARRSDLAHDIERSANHQRRNAMRLDRVRDETDGLMTERSVGHEQREIGPGFD
jgi:hypothetical protein